MIQLGNEGKRKIIRNKNWVHNLMRFSVIIQYLKLVFILQHRCVTCLCQHLPFFPSPSSPQLTRDGGGRGRLPACCIKSRPAQPLSGWQNGRRNRNFIRPSGKDGQTKPPCIQVDELVSEFGQTKGKGGKAHGGKEEGQKGRRGREEGKPR